MHLWLDCLLFVDMDHPQVALLFTGEMLVSLNCRVARVHLLPFWLLEHIWSYPRTLVAPKVLILLQNGNFTVGAIPIL